MSGDTRIPNFKAMPIAIEIGRLLKPACEKIAIAGSLRRKKPDVGDIELVAIPRVFEQGNVLHWLTDKLLDEGLITPPERKAWGLKQRKFMFKGIQIDLYLADWQNWGYIYWLRTGPGDANQYIMWSFMKKKSLYEKKGGYVWYDKERLWLNSEAKWLRLLGFPDLRASDRTLTRYKQLINAPDHRWGDPLPYLHQPYQLQQPTKAKTSVPVVKQMSLMDAAKPPEQAPVAPKIRIVSIDPPPAPPAQDIWQIDPLFMVDNLVWVNRRLRWTLEPSNSDAVRAFMAFLQAYPSTLKGFTLNLRQHLAHEPQWLGSQFFFDEEMQGDFYDETLHKWFGRPKIEDVPIEKLMASGQDSTLRSPVQKYYYRYRRMGREGFRNRDDAFPIALKFNDDAHYWVTDGHHRFQAALLLDLPDLICQVDYIDKSINDCVMWWDEEELLEETD